MSDIINDNPGELIIDDRNPGIDYSRDQWRPSGSRGEHDRTTTWTAISGATAKFVFSGAQISVYGTISQIGMGISARSSYSIDDGQETPFEAVQTRSTLFRQLFYRSQFLSPGPHTLTIRNFVDNGFLFLDFFRIDTATLNDTLPLPPGNNLPQATGTLLPTTGIDIPTQAFSDPASTPTSSALANSPADQVASTSTSSLPVGKIVGSCVGGVALLFLLLVAFVLWQRRRRRNRTAPSAMFIEARMRYHSDKNSQLASRPMSLG